MTIPKQDDDFLARLVGGAIVRARCVNAGETVVERLRERAEKAELERDDLSLALIKARRAYADVWSDVTRNELVAGVFRSSARQRRAARRLAAVPTWLRCPACGELAELVGMEACECEPRRELPEGPL